MHFVEKSPFVQKDVVPLCDLQYGWDVRLSLCVWCATTTGSLFNLSCERTFERRSILVIFVDVVFVLAPKTALHCNQSLVNDCDRQIKAFCRNHTKTNPRSDQVFSALLVCCQRASAETRICGRSFYFQVEKENRQRVKRWWHIYILSLAGLKGEEA